MDHGAHWLAVPRPQLDAALYDLDEDGLPALSETEPVFEAANVLRVGRDILYQVSHSGNEAGWGSTMARPAPDSRTR